MRRTVLVTLLIAVMAIFTGCSKDTEKEELRQQVTELQDQVKELETQNQDLKSQLDQAALKLADQNQLKDDLAKALETRLLHHPLSEFSISPSVSTDNGWLLVDGEHTYTLGGYSGASKVLFYWADESNAFKPTEAGADSNGTNGWSWTGTLPPGNMRAFWAEAHYPGNVVVKSGVLPLRSTGK